MIARTRAGSPCHFQNEKVLRPPYACLCGFLRRLGGSLSAVADSAGSRAAAGQRPRRLRCSPGFAGLLHHSRHWGTSDAVLSRWSSTGPQPGCRDGEDHRDAHKGRGVPHRSSREEYAWGFEESLPDRCGRKNRADSLDGLDRLELLGRLPRTGQDFECGAFDGCDRPDQPWMDLYQH